MLENIKSFLLGREEAATPTPSRSNVETVSIDEKGNTSVRLCYQYKGTAEEIQEEKRNNALYEGTTESPADSVQGKSAQ